MWGDTQGAAYGPQDGSLSFGTKMVVQPQQAVMVQQQQPPPQRQGDHYVQQQLHTQSVESPRYSWRPSEPKYGLQEEQPTGGLSPESGQTPHGELPMGSLSLERPPPEQRYVLHTQHVTQPMCINQRPSLGAESSSEQKYTLDALFVAFTNIQYTPCRGGYRDWLNRLSQRTGNLIHCELVFRMVGRQDTETIHVCCTVYFGQNVVFEKNKAYDNRIGKWQRYRIGCSPEQMHTIYTFCCNQKDKPFNRWGYYLNFLPGPLSWMSYRGGGNSWFCSELVLAALQEAFPNLRSYQTHKTPPTALCDILARHGFTLMDTITKKDTEQLLNNLNV